MNLNCYFSKSLGDLVSPVGIYLRIRDHFPRSFLLEGSDYNGVENSCSFIGMNALMEVEISDSTFIKKIKGQVVEKIEIQDRKQYTQLLQDFLNSFKVKNKQVSGPNIDLEGPVLGLFGYITYEAIECFEDIKLKAKIEEERKIPIARYVLFKNVIQINHYKSEMFIQQYDLEGIEESSESEVIDNLKDLENKITYDSAVSSQFSKIGDEISNFSDQEYLEVVERCKTHIKRGDVFQIVPSRRFSQKYRGDDFQVYRALRAINPSPYLFYYDCGDFRLFGSSPEALIVLKNGVASSYPIAGTYFRKGTEEDDIIGSESLLKDEKENAEHVMLVDLARNDLSRLCSQVKVSKYKEVQFYSHVIHLVSKVDGVLDKKISPFELIQATFPAGTLSGAPKYRAMELIDSLEKGHRSHYAGAVGFVTFDGNLNHAIMIRSFLSKNNMLHYQAGGGIVADSIPEMEVQEVKNKLGALKKAIEAASKRGVA